MPHSAAATRGPAGSSGLSTSNQSSPLTRGPAVVFASGENFTDIDSPLHTDFKLNKDGDFDSTRVISPACDLRYVVKTE